MSLFNDIDWRKIDENCISSAVKVKSYAMKFSQRHCNSLGSGSEKKWHGSSLHAQEGECDSTANKKEQRSKETDHLEFKSISALSRGIFKAEER